VTKDGRIWWQGYRGQQVVLFDDYRGETGFSEMLRITHELRFVGDVKGTDVTVNPAFVVFTTNEPYTMWMNWKNYDKSPFDRRITDHFQMSWEKPSGGGMNVGSVIQLENGIHVHTLKGKLESVVDPPDDMDGNDDEVEDQDVEAAIAEVPEGEGWLPRKRVRYQPAAAEIGPEVQSQEVAEIMNHLGDRP